MKRKPHTMVSAVSLLCSAHSIFAATLHHQGVVAVNGERFTGTGAFRFALIDANTSAYLWVNDGSTVSDPDSPTDPVSLTVINGVYNVLLGDAALTHMTAIPDALFQTHKNVVLRVWFNDNAGNGTHALAPDLAITAAPFANVAANAQRLVVPGTANSAVAAQPTGEVHVDSGDLVVNTGHVVIADGDLFVQKGGDAHISGDSTVGGNFTVLGSFVNFSVTGPHTAQRTNGTGSTSTNMSLVADSFCTLTSQRVDVDRDDFGFCKVHDVAGRWVLTASLGLDGIEAAFVFCEAQCFVFGE